VAEDLVPSGERAPEVQSSARIEPIEIVPLRPADPGGVFRSRFAIAYLALAVMAGVGIGAAVVLFDRPQESAGAPWSNWKPSGSESTFDTQIADYVASRYALPSGNPLVVVIPGAPTISAGDTELTIRNVVIQDDPQGDRDGFRVVDVADSRMYQLCGLGDRCSIREGAPSEERMQLLRREALELALYTFKYTDDTDTVITLLPPNLGDASTADDDTAVALFFEKSAVRPQLEQPLSETLLSRHPPQAAELDSLENLIVERLTLNRLFVYEFQPAQAGGAIMLLARPNVG
jgi:hypothetical protein